MKKLLALLLALTMAFAMTACGGTEETTAAAEEETTAAAEEETTAAAEEETTAATEETGDYTGGEYAISIGHVCEESHSLQTACLKFKEDVEAASGGKITVEIFPNAVLGGDEAMIESVAMGTLTMCVPSATVLNTYVPAYGIMAMPYLFSSTDQAFAAMDGELGQLLIDKMAEANTGFYTIGYNFNGIRNMTNNVRPIEKLADLQGLKMRCMSNELFIKMFELLGANATPMSWDELFTAMSQGTVDGQENPASLMYASKFYEVQKYCSTTEHVYDFCTININADFYDGLDDQAKAIVDKYTKEDLGVYQRELEVSQNADFLQALADEGMEVTYLDDAAKAEFAAAVAPMYDDAEAQFGADIMAAVEPYR